MSAQPIRRHFSEAPSVVYERETHGVAAESRRLVKRSDGTRLGMHHATIEAPADYAGVHEEDMVFYALAGAGTVFVDDEEHAFGPGVAVLVKGGSRYRHVVPDETQTVLLLFSPAPTEGHHH